MQSNQFESLEGVYDKTKHLVETVKLGDVMYHIAAKKVLLNNFIGELEVSLANTSSIELREWYQGKIDAYKTSLEVLDLLCGNVRNCK